MQGAEHGEHVLQKSIASFKKKKSQDSLPTLKQKFFILTNWVKAQVVNKDFAFVDLSTHLNRVKLL